ncbi:MAG: hypothetical protein EXR77_03830 [Myxococcales bacterium]|nr:hypothetical protein [Myxococcales bacterium]
MTELQVAKATPEVAKMIADLAAQPATPSSEPPPVSKWWDWAQVVAPTAAAVWAYRSSLHFGLIADARFLIVENTKLRSWSDLWPNVTHDYFWSSSGNTIPYWRPLTKASWLAETIAGAGATWPFHAMQVLWFAMACVGVAVLARTLGAWPLWAVLAGVVAALHPVALEPVGLVMARSDVVAAAGALWALIGFARQLQDPKLRWLALHIAGLAVALASKEAAVTLPVVLLVWLLQVRDRDQTWRATLMPALPALVLALGYVVARRVVLGDRQGAEIAFDPLRMLAGAGQYALGLLPGRSESSIHNLPLTMAIEPLRMAAWLLALASWGLWLGWSLRKRCPDAMLLIWMALSIAPVLMVKQLNVPGVDGKIALADRWLFLAMLAMQVLLALVVSRLRHRWLARTGFVAAAVWTAVRLADIDAQVAAYADDASLVALEDRQFAATPLEHRTQQDRCRFAIRTLITLGQRGDFAEVVAASERAEPACRYAAEFRFNRFVALVENRQYSLGIAEGRRLLADPPADRRYAASLRFLMGRALVKTSQHAAAESMLRESLKMGLQTCESAQLLAQALQAKPDAAGAAKWYERAAACLAKTGQANAAEWSAAARQWQTAGNRERALRAIERSGPPSVRDPPAPVMAAPPASDLSPTSNPASHM